MIFPFSLRSGYGSDLCPRIFAPVVDGVALPPGFDDESNESDDEVDEDDDDEEEERSEASDDVWNFTRSTSPSSSSPSLSLSTASE